MVEVSETRQTSVQGGRISARESGFTLIELIIVMAIIALLVSIAVPSYVQMIKRTKEAALHEDLHTIRTAIDSYTVDKTKGPQGLEDLVQSGYLKEVPKDPMTSRNDTWITSEGSNLIDLGETQGGIDDVHSGAQGLSTDGTSYNTW